ncbi:MAG: glycosyltransferase family 4 protein [Sphingomonadaceae bacterium]|nr:glycosyltransferase family 4 protein [Sphingomonadaceae bacterium]
MKVLLTHRYFMPDSSPYGLILQRIAKGLAAEGHEVEVFTSRPSYGRAPAKAPRRERLGDVAVRRVWVLSEASRNPVVRGVNLLLYCVTLFIYILRTRADVVTACTYPPVLAAWIASLATLLSGARFVYHIQDIHPEVSTYSGGRLGRGLAARLLTALDNQTLRRAVSIVTLSDDMAETLRSRGLGPLPITLINNPALEPDGKTIAPPPDLVKPADTTRVIFAGNLGRFQNLPLLADGVAKCFAAHPKLELMFLGDGVALPELKARWGNHPQVRFAPFLPFAQARSIIGGADIGLVSLEPNIYRVAYPSKVATYRALGLKILALVEPESQLARELVEQDRGAAPISPTPEAISEALEKLLAAPSSGHEVYGKEPTGRVWHDLLIGTQ